MKRIALMLVVSLIATTGQTQSWFSKLFKPPRKAVQHHKRSVKKSKVTPKPTDNLATYFAVDKQWLADYREQEVAWDYYISDDAKITFKNGQYYVPPSVFYHYNDMLIAHSLNLQDQ